MRLRLGEENSTMKSRKKQFSKLIPTEHVNNSIQKSNTLAAGLKIQPNLTPGEDVEGTDVFTLHCGSTEDINRIESYFTLDHFSHRPYEDIPSFRVVSVRSSHI